MIPWEQIGYGYLGFVMYLLMAVSDKNDESFGSIADIFFNRGRTVLAGAVSVPILIVILKETGQANMVASFFGGYANVSMFRKFADNHIARFEGGVK